MPEPTLQLRAASRSGRRAARAGALTTAPIVVGYVPFALVIGRAIAERHAGVAGWSGSWLIYGGSAHLAAMQLVSSSGALVAVATGLLVNARLLAYSTSLGRTWRDQPRWFRAVAAALVIDATWALAEEQADQPPPAQRAYFLASGLVLGAGWSIGIAVGATVGSHLDLDSIRVVVPLCFAALVAPKLVQPGERLPIVAAGAAALATSGGPTGTSAIAAIAAGCVAGELADRSRR